MAHALFLLGRAHVKRAVGRGHPGGTASSGQAGAEVRRAALNFADRARGL